MYMVTITPFFIETDLIIYIALFDRRSIKPV